jgi:hypothetical protein
MEMHKYLLNPLVDNISRNGNLGFKIKVVKYKKGQDCMRCGMSKSYKDKGKCAIYGKYYGNYKYK